MVHIDVDVQHPVVVLEQLQYGEDNVVDVTETRGLRCGRRIYESGMDLCECVGRYDSRTVYLRRAVTKPTRSEVSLIGKAPSITFMHAFFLKQV